MRKLDVPANALVVVLGVALIFSYSTVSALINSSDSASKKDTQAQPALTGKINSAQSIAIKK